MLTIITFNKEKNIANLFIIFKTLKINNVLIKKSITKVVKDVIIYL